ncbi:hypothetical protein Lsan_3262 [Legionella santicrucis]|uniref:Uncharacterized protein n=1 Tax=Legionella santicrucis TaxID=45074 RepID=A0A0W0YGS5_9GAMM|nr:hypothetical protein Lsan_3262 [Legionella santicrucis]
MEIYRAPQGGQVGCSNPLRDANKDTTQNQVLNFHTQYNCPVCVPSTLLEYAIAALAAGTGINPGK